MNDQTIRATCPRRNEAGDQQRLSQRLAIQAKRHGADRDGRELKIQLPLGTGLHHRAAEPETAFRDCDAGRCVTHSTARHRHRSDPKLVHSCDRNSHCLAATRAETVAYAAAACSAAALRASSRSTTFIIGEAVASAFFILIVRWRSTASL